MKDEDISSFLCLTKEEQLEALKESRKNTIETFINTIKENKIKLQRDQVKKILTFIKSHPIE